MSSRKLGLKEFTYIYGGRNFLEVKGYISESCLNRELENANVFASIDGEPSTRAACYDFLTSVFRLFFVKKSGKILIFP